MVLKQSLVWCLTPGQEWPKTNVQECEWKLDVPETAFLKIVDCMVWEGILKNDVVPTGRLREYLEQGAKWSNANDRIRILKEKAAPLIHPPGDPWESLFLEDANDLRAHILLKHPIEQSWVKSTKPY